MSKIFKRVTAKKQPTQIAEDSERSVIIGRQEFPTVGGALQKPSGLAPAAVSVRQTFQFSQTKVAGGAVNTVSLNATFQVTRNCRIRKVQYAGFKVDAAGVVAACNMNIGLLGANGSVVANPPVSGGGFVGALLLFAPVGHTVDVNYEADDSLMLYPNVTYTVSMDLWSTFAATDTGYFRFQLQIEYL